MRHSDTLTPDSWIAAGFRALTAGGPQAVKVEAIARELGVSKGSFYWHFKDALAFKRAMLSHWTEVATRNVISEVRESSPDPRAQLRRLVEIATGGRSDPYGGKLAEAAIRDWARYDPDAASTVKDIDRQRLAFLESLFAESGIPAARAGVYAGLFFGAFIGLEQLHYHGLANANDGMIMLLEVLLANHPALIPPPVEAPAVRSRRTAFPRPPRGTPHPD